MIFGKRKKALPACAWLALVAALFAVIIFASRRHSPVPTPAPLTPGVLAAQWPQIVAHAAGPPRGNPQATYTIVEFGDFQCPQCDEIRPVLEHWVAHGAVQWYFVHRPFPNNHVWAVSAAKAADVAAAQGKFWPMCMTCCTTTRTTSAGTLWRLCRQRRPGQGEVPGGLLLRALRCGGGFGH